MKKFLAHIRIGRKAIFKTITTGEESELDSKCNQYSLEFIANDQSQGVSVWGIAKRF
jgi:hypothetical protein